MEDSRIIELYWLRDESAIQVTSRKYGPYLFKIAYNILTDIRDSEESVNDTYLKAWNSMPPHRPGFSRPSSERSPGSCPLTGSVTGLGKSGRIPDTCLSFLNGRYLNVVPSERGFFN